MVSENPDRVPPRRWAERTAPPRTVPDTAIWSSAVIAAVPGESARATCARRVAVVATTSSNSPTTFVTASIACPNTIVSSVAPFRRSSVYRMRSDTGGPQPSVDAETVADSTSPTAVGHEVGQPAEGR